jgi:hypothetical protein
VNRLELWRHDVNNISIYEPCAGAGIFLVAALRQLRELLPLDWTDKQRHEFLVQRINGDEIDAFAREVATLSLILADYPNANGWAVSELDLFKGNQIAERARLGNVVLCNPPFESFTPAERSKYSESASRSSLKPIAILDAVLDAAPVAIGFVLPEPFIKGPQYKAQRKRIEKLYTNIELVSLPDRIFKHSVIRSSLVIARDLRQTESSTTTRSTVVSAQDREQFLRGGNVSEVRTATRSSFRDGNLWINELEGIWDSLVDNLTLESVATAHMGLQWQEGQANAVRSTPHKGFVLGVHAANAIKAFALQQSDYLDYRQHNIRRAGDLPWASAKILANAARLSRGPWCFAAAIENEGLVFSQQLFGIWPKAGMPLPTLCALLNSPVANAYIASHSPADRIRVGTVLSIPLPTKIPQELEEMSKRYARTVVQGEGLFSSRRAEQADKLLNQIDAVVLKAYDLSPKLERRLLEYFRGSERPVVHSWQHWFPQNFQPYIPLHRYLSDEYRTATSGSVLSVFKPLPKDEAEAVREYMD